MTEYLDPKEVAEAIDRGEIGLNDSFYLGVEEWQWLCDDPEDGTHVFIRIS